jgi:hypothetical protein
MNLRRSRRDGRLSAVPQKIRRQATGSNGQCNETRHHRLRFAPRGDLPYASPLPADPVPRQILKDITRPANSASRGG